ncbi:MAG TPA: hypothetical protein VLF40_03595 [Candidatus Saccharimonadales bacterium]|nr:hypothetical protein [Candidatus Saccharimonadales bacterium]
MPQPNHHLLPSAFELWCVGLAAAAVLAIGNAKVFLERYGLVGSSDVVRGQLSHQVGSGLAVLDTFKLTAALATFVAWSIFGLIIFSIIYSVVHTTRVIREQHELGSEAYIHPRHFDPAGYRRQVIRAAVVSFLLLGALAVSLLVCVLLVFPISIAYTRHFLLQTSLAHTLDFAIGCFTVFVATLALYTLCRVTLRHYRQNTH